MPAEPRAAFPLWLELSGLPAIAAQSSKGAAAWAIFKKVVELDIAMHSAPGTVEISPADLAARAGVPPGQVRKALLALRKLKLIACFIPEDDDENALLRVRTPLEPAMPRDAIATAMRKHGLDPGAGPWRYLDEAGPAAPGDATLKPDPALQEIVDLYFNAIGLRMNAFVLDELHLLRHRYPLDDIRKCFNRARQNEIRSLHWVVRELARGTRKREKGSKNTGE